MSNPQCKKYCVVPKCVNTTTNAPEKMFFVVPTDPEMRKKWIKLMRRADPFGAKSTLYCCEDHFDVENDMENYVKYKLVGGKKKLKQGVVPHKFECQKGKNENPERSAVHKGNQINFFEKSFHEDAIPSIPEPPVEVFVACCENKHVVEDPLGLKNNAPCLKTSKHHKAVQVQFKNKVQHKATSTEKKYFKKQKINALNKTPVR